MHHIVYCKRQVISDIMAFVLPSQQEQKHKITITSIKWYLQKICNK